MQLSQLHPTLWVKEVKAAIDWYVQVLGFTEANYVEDWQWGAVQKDQVLIMLAQPNSHTSFEGPHFTGSFYFNTDDVEAWWEKLKNSPHVYYELESFEYGMREFAIKDLNGYILQFGQRIDKGEEQT